MNKKHIGPEILTALLYSFFCPIFFGWYTDVNYTGDSGLIFIAILFVALVAASFLFILSIILNKNGKTGFLWLGMKILFGIFVFETSSLIILDYSFLYGIINRGHPVQFLFSLASLTSLVVFYGLNTIFLKLRSIK